MLHSTTLLWIVHPKTSIEQIDDQPLGESIELSLLGDDTVGVGVDVPAVGRPIEQTSGGIKLKLFVQGYNMFVWVLSF